MKTRKLTRRELLKFSALAGLGLVVEGLGTRASVAQASENRQVFYRLNDMQDFIRGHTNNQFGIGYGRAWGITGLGEPAMVADNLGGFPFQPTVIDDAIYGQMLDLNVHRLSKKERELLDRKGSAIVREAHRLGIVAQDFASSAFHVYPPAGFSRMEVTLKLPRGMHEKTVKGIKVTTGIDNTFAGLWILADLERLSADIDSLQKDKGLPEAEAARIKRTFADVNVEIDILEAVGHSDPNLSSIMSGVHLQGVRGRSGNSLYYDRLFFYNESGPKWLQFMVNNSSPFDWAKDYLNIVFEFDKDGHWRTYYNEIEMVNSKTVVDKVTAPFDELVHRIPVRTITTSVGPLDVTYFIIFHAAPGGLWPGQPTAPNDLAYDGLQVANLLLR